MNLNQITEPLVNKKIREAKRNQKGSKLFVGEGLHLHVSPQGSAIWRYKYRFHGKEKLISYGKFPAIKPLKARKLHIASQELLTDNIDPVDDRRQKQRKEEVKAQEHENSFEKVARLWLEKMSSTWTDRHYKKVEACMADHIFPEIGHWPITTIRSSDLLRVLEKTQNQGKHETTNRLRARCEQVFKYAVVRDLCGENPAWNLRGELIQPTVTSMATLDRKEMPDFLKKICVYSGHPITKNAVFFLAHTFVRTKEMRFAKWEEFDLEDMVWTIPGERMKTRQNFKGQQPDHKVAITPQVVAILDKLREYNGEEMYVFATPQRSGKTVSLNPRPRKPLSENAVLKAIEITGYKGRMTGHGFRSFASTQLNETGFDPDVIEMQLAHIDSNRTRAAYNRAEYLEKRREMMRQWSNYIDSMIHGAKVIPIGKRAS